MIKNPKTEFAIKLINWHNTSNERIMPWKGEADPYKIWLSEIILQQTRVEQGLDYYLKFIEEFPDIESLANANDDLVFKLWEGLGYYSRCRNLLQTARFIHFELSGKFPDKYEEILKLKGVGPYTAAAIASFAYAMPHAVVDGNVLRVLSRFFGEMTSVDSTNGKKLFENLANEVLDKKSPGSFNQAIMDFGATICKPKQPLCAVCPLKIDCTAFNENRVNILPVKEKSLIKKDRWMNYFVLENEGSFWVKKREKKDIWQNLFEFYLYETTSNIDLNEKEWKKIISQKLRVKRFEVTDISHLFAQTLTHRNIKGRFIHIKLYDLPEDPEGGIFMDNNGMFNLAFPQFIRQYLKTCFPKLTG